MPDIQEMNKKQLKDYVKLNGFFQKFSANKITAEEAAAMEFESNALDTGITAPTGDNIVIFNGIVSQNFGKGEMSRNGYKIDQKGWNMDNFMKSPKVLLQHNMEYGGIGNVMKFGYNKNGDLTSNFYVDLNCIKDEATKYQIQNDYINGASTTHLTNEFMIEDNETGTRYTADDAEEKFGWQNVMMAMYGCSDTLTMVVTEAEMIELSLVTIGSNPDAMVAHNSIPMYFEGKAADMFKDKDKNSFKSDILKGFIKQNGFSLNGITSFMNEIGIEATPEEVEAIHQEVETEKIVEEAKDVIDEKTAVVENTESNDIIDVEEVKTEEVKEATDTVEEVAEVKTEEPETVVATDEVVATEVVAENAETVEANATETQTEIEAAPETVVEQPASEIPAEVDQNALTVMEERIMSNMNEILTNALKVIDGKINDVVSKTEFADEEKNAIVEIITDLATNVVKIGRVQKNTIVDAVNIGSSQPAAAPEKAISPFGQKLQNALRKAGM